jgi:GPI transamidase subunit PIG-U
MIEASTFLATVVRLLVVVAPHVSHGRRPFLPTTNFIYSPLLQSLFVRPHQTLVHVQEASAIQKLLSGRFVGAYQAHQAIRLPPLVLAAALTLLPLEQKEREEDDSSAGSNGGFTILSHELWVSLFLLAVDLLIGYYLQAVGKELLLPSKPDAHVVEEERLQLLFPSAIQPPNGTIFPLTREPQGNDVPPLFPMTELPTLAANVYYWSPVTVLAGGTYHCFQNVPCLFLLVAIHEACKRQRKSLSLAAFSLASAAYLEPHYCVFLVPLAIWAFQHSPKQTQEARQQRKVILLFVFWSVVFQGLSYSLVGPTQYWNVVKASYGSGWKNMGPNLSLLWYFQIQLFSRFRDYFAIIITGLPYVLIAPLTARLYKYPMALVRAH